MRELRDLVIVVVFRYEEVILLEEGRHFLRDWGAKVKSKRWDEQHFEEAGVRGALRLRSEVNLRSLSSLSLIIDDACLNIDKFNQLQRRWLESAHSTQTNVKTFPRCWHFIPSKTRVLFSTNWLELWRSLLLGMKQSNFPPNQMHWWSSILNNWWSNHFILQLKTIRFNSISGPCSKSFAEKLDMFNAAISVRCIQFTIHIWNLTLSCYNLYSYALSIYWLQHANAIVPNQIIGIQDAEKRTKLVGDETRSIGRTKKLMITVQSLCSVWRYLIAMCVKFQYKKSILKKSRLFL